MGEAVNGAERQVKRQSAWLAFSLCLFVALHYTLFFTGLYWEYRSLDIPMHFFGGAWMAAFSVYFFFTRGPVRAHSVFYEGLIILGFAALTGVAWEFHEFVFDTFITDRRLIMQGGSAEIMGDLFFDMLGATMTVTLRYAHFLWKNQQNHLS
ncbi:MAG: hypothetical protein Q7R63_01555 [bacterium]|nr:hypothetical protein [bacterium]